MTTHQRRQLMRLVTQYARRGWSVAYGLLRDADEAYDAVQQGYMVAARKPHAIPEDDPWPWFGVVVAHEARNLRRKKRPTTNRDVQPSLAVEGSDPQAVTHERELMQRVREAIDSLPLDERDAVTLIHMTGMTHAAAAEALDVPRQTVTLRAKRGLERLAHRLRAPLPEIPRYVAGISVAAPTFGWDVAKAQWSANALTSSTIGATTPVATSVTAAGGVAVATKPIWIVSLLTAFGLGLVGGGVWQASRTSAADASASQQTKENASLTGPSDATPKLKSSSSEAAGDEATSAEAWARLRSENEILRRKMEELSKRLEEAKRKIPDHKGPLFTFGPVGQLPAVRDANWRYLAHASKVVSDVLRERLRYRDAGEAVPRELNIRMQEHTEQVRTYEYRTLDRIASDARHNGELTHPISLCNLLGAMVEEAGHSLTEDQVAAITTLGKVFDKQYEDLRKQLEGAPRVKRIVEEYRLKGRFVEDLKGVLTPEQRAVAYNEATEGMAGLDLYCPTLMILHTSPVIGGTSADEIGTKLTEILIRKYGIADEHQASLARIVASWTQATSSLVSNVVPENRVRNYTFAEGLSAGEATVALVDQLLRDIELTDEAKKKVMDDYAIYVPRRVVEGEGK